MKQPTVLVTGGAGYIGSHMLLALKHLPFKVIVVDNLSTGLKQNIVHGQFIEGDLRDKTFVHYLLKEHDIDAVLHFAASVSVPESVCKPQMYYENNTLATFHLIQACIENNVKHFLFSSTAAVYGEPSGIISEASPCNPMNPYGKSKWLAEMMIQDCFGPLPINYGILRYFNVAGVDASIQVGPSAKKESNLFKAVLNTALGKQASFQIYGHEYPTKDGSCERDFIHVSDLIDAHCLVLKHMMIAPTKALYNCSYGVGYSVKDVVSKAQALFNKQFPVQIASNRDGDPAKVIASPQKLMRELGWKPQHNDIDLMLNSMMLWEQKLKETVV